MTTNKLTRSEVMKLTVSDAREAIVRLYLSQLAKPGYAREVTTWDVANALGCSEAKVRDLLMPMVPVWKDNPNGPMRRTLAPEGIDHKPGSSAGFGRGSYPETWAPSFDLLAERLAAGLALAPERTPATFGPTDPMTEQSPF